MRTPPPTAAGERETLEAFLDFHRETLIEKCLDLSGEQLASRSCPPSALSLQGLLRHMAKVERWWFRMYMCGMPLPPLNTSREHPDLDFAGVDPARWEQDMEVYRGEIAAASDAVVAFTLDDLSRGEYGNPVSLRWIYLHMLAEYARHNGHADLLREAVDGRTGV